MPDLADAIGELVRAAVKAELGPLLARLEEPQAPALLDGQALARALGVSERQVRRLVASGMPHFRVVESRRFELNEVLAWLKERQGAA